MTVTSMGVFGCGPIGLLIVQVLWLSGTVKIVATDLLPQRVEAAKALSANHIFLTDGRQDVSPILAATGQRGVDVVFEAAQSAVDDAFAAFAPSFFSGISRRDVCSCRAVCRHQDY